MSTIAARIIIYCMVGVPIVYDIVALIFNWPTISQTMRDLDQQSGSLFRWLTLLGWLAVWLHCFMRSPWGGWNR